MIYIGIDPDTKNSGVAFWDNKSKVIFGFCAPFFTLFEYLQRNRPDKVIIEAGWLNSKSNFHSNPYQSKNAGERISKNVGANHETGRKIVEMCEYLQIPCEQVRPCSQKYSKEYCKELTGVDTKNQDIVDAVMLVYGL